MTLIRHASMRLLVLAAVLCCNLAAAQNREASATNPQLVAANNAFGFALLPQLQKQAPDGNIFYSPLSITQALSMVYNGAGGATQREMRAALGFEQLGLEELNQSSAALLKELRRDDAGVKLAIANSLWTRQGITFDRGFLERNQQFYQAEISPLDFADPGSVATINDWVARSTRGKIPSIIDKLEPDAAAVLINAVYFKGTWFYPFPASQTFSEVFFLPGGGQSKVPMMNTRETLSCYASEGIRAVALPYAFGAQMELYMPDHDAPIAELLRKLDYDSYRRWKGALQHSLVTLKLPRVKLRYAADLKPALRALGMNAAFTRRADFSGMAVAEKLFIAKVNHKTTLEIDEQGTEATAVTMSGMRAISVPPPCMFTGNRPFVVVISDRKSDAILFMGVVTNPQAEPG